MNHPPIPPKCEWFFTAPNEVTVNFEAFDIYDGDEGPKSLKPIIAAVARCVKWSE